LGALIYSSLDPPLESLDDSLELSNIIVFLDGFFLCFSFVGLDLGLFFTTIISSSVSSPDVVSTVESSS
jgi:hypothetical protein